MLVINNPKLAEKLERIARRRNETVERMIERLADELEPDYSDLLPSPEDMLKQIRARFYADARTYWDAHGDSERLAMTAEDFEKRLEFFDENGRPILKGDPGWDAPPPPGSLRALALAALDADLHFGRDDSAERSREILEREFGVSKTDSDDGR